MNHRPEPVLAQMVQAQRGLTELSIKLAIESRERSTL